MKTAVVCALAVASAAAVGGVALMRTDRAPVARDFAAAPSAPSTTVPSSQPTQPTRDYPKRYASLLDRSIFVDPRDRAVATDAQPPKAEPTARKEATFVLRGVTVQGQQFTALVEDTAARTVRRLAPGDAIAGGRLARISLQGVEYEADGERKRVEIGHSLDGAAGIVTVTASAAPTGPVPDKRRRPKKQDGEPPATEAAAKAHVE